MELTHAWRGAGVPLCSTVTCVRWYSALVLCKRSMRGPWGAGSCWYEFRGNCDWLQARVLTSLHTLAHRLAGLGPLWDVSDTFPFSSKTQPIILFSIYFKSSDLRQIFLSSVFRENCEVWSVNPAPPRAPDWTDFFCLRRTVREICCKFCLYLLFISYASLNLSVGYVRCKSNPNAGLDRPFGLQDVEASKISRHSAHEGGKIVSPTHRPPLPCRRWYPWYSFPLEAESTPGP